MTISSADENYALCVLVRYLDLPACAFSNSYLLNICTYLMGYVTKHLSR
ncbi:hypothetical protein PUN28_013000 [Cardiocondyla obscurior]|uniref:Uncharacterized protein n=1 Tax=Cardiocondyla obscurior TaxID=286306 RepID=A0AAW2F7Q3_9HYME